MGIKKIVLKLVVGGSIAALGLLGLFGQYVSLALIIIGYLVVGADVLLEAIKNVFKGNALDENFLMSIATVGAFILGESAEAVFVMVFYQIGEAFQCYAVGKSRKSISQLMDIRPEFANVKRDGDIVKVEPDEVMVDEIIVVKPGEKIPLDGVVIEGMGAVDTRALTGEALPEDVEIGSSVLSGCISINGRLTVKVIRTYTDSTVAKILDLVENASARKSKSEKFITKFARYYTPCVVIAAVILAVVPPLLSLGTFYDWFYRALSFLVISCPCALVISIPLGFFGGIGGAAKNGVLMKGSSYVESLAKADVVVFDKTGTLTKGEFIIKQILNEEGLTQEELLEVAAIAESSSNHPIAQSIVKEYGKKITQTLESVDEIAGKGIKVSYGKSVVYAGNDKLLDEIGVQYRKVDTVGSVVHIVRDSTYLGCVLVSDEVKKDSADTVSALKRMGIKKTIMLTGDKDEAAKAIGKEVGVDVVYSELLPADKVQIAEKEIAKVKKKRTLAYVGDGINDAPVLARADVGIAMGGAGSHAAIEAADVVIINDEPSKIVTAIKIAKKTLSIVKQNIALAFIIKALIMVLAAFGLSGLWAAIFADVGVAVLVSVFIPN